MSTQPLGIPRVKPDLLISPALASESCPTCGQLIPPDKLEEISGRIAARERERVAAITAQLESQFAAERAKAASEAGAALELERQQSAIREARAREQAKADADKRIQEQQTEFDRTRAELVAGMRQQLDSAESARKLAEETGANLQTQITALQESYSKSIEAVKAQASEREVEIRNEAKQAADREAADRVAAIETAHKEVEAALLTQVQNAEISKSAAEQKQTELESRLGELQKGQDIEIAKVKEQAAEEASRRSQAAIAEVESRFQGQLTTQQAALAEANAKLAEAATKISGLSQDHSTEMRVLREALEKAKDEAVNAEKAKAFEEGQKLSTKVNELQRALDKKTSEELGEGAEVDVFEALKGEFPDDRICRVPKGAPGADVRHTIMFRGKPCGTILYDSKNHKAWRDEFVTKLRKDQLADKAEHAILSTHKFPEGKRQIHIRDGVLIANPARVVTVATIVRQHLIQLHTLRLSRIERENKTLALYEFITSEQCSLLLNQIDQRAESLLKLQETEMSWHQRNWNRQGEVIRAIQKAKVNLENEISAIIGTSADESAMSEAS